MARISSGLTTFFTIGVFGIVIALGVVFVAGDLIVVEHLLSSRHSERCGTIRVRMVEVEAGASFKFSDSIEVFQ